MKKILLTILGVLFSVQLAFAALSASTLWEVRTTGDALNGGGYVSGGTDYSQQDAAQLSLTDGYFTSGVTLKSDTGGFTAAMVGNLIYIASGTHFTAGYYQIATYVDTNTITLDRASASEDTSAHKDAAFKVGGATNHPQTIAPSVVAGNTIYIASGTYVKVGANAYVLSTTNSVKWRGYITNHSTVAYKTDRPLLDAATTTTNSLVDNGGEYYNLRFSRATGVGVVVQSSYFENCLSYNNSSDGFSRATYVSPVFYKCEAYGNGGAGFYMNIATGLKMLACYSHDNTSEGVNQSAYSIIALKTICESNTGSGFANNAGGVFIECIAYNNTGGGSDGFSGVGNFVVNNISMNNGRYGFNGTANLFDYNSYYGNATAGLNNITAGSHDITSDPKFTAPTANPPDFTLQSDSPCKDAGFPDADWAANVGLVAGRY